MSRAALRVAVAVVVAAVALLSAAPAWAHAELVRSDPPNGGAVAVGRSELTLWFGEAIRTGASTFELRPDDSGRPVAVTASRGDGGVVRLRTPALRRGTYTLSWQVLSLDDGHTSRGSIVFGAGTRPAVAAAGGTLLPDRSVLAPRLLDLLALLLAVGALVVSERVLVATGPAGARPRGRARRIAVLAAGTAAVTGALTPFVRVPRADRSVAGWAGQTWDTLTGTSWGQLWLVREAALVVTVVCLAGWLVARPAPGARPRLAAAALVVASCCEAWTGHAATLQDGSSLAALGSAAHVLAAGVWAGGLAVLVLCVVPVMRAQPALRGPLLASVWRAFSPLAAGSTVVLLATGLYETGRHVPDAGALTGTTYGGAVTAKALLLAVALSLASANVLVVNPGLAARVARRSRRPVGWTPVPAHRFSTMVVAEVAVLFLAVVGAAVATSVPTAREVARTVSASAPQVDHVDGLFLTVEQVPAGDRSSRLVVRLRSTVQPEPAPVREVGVLLVGPGNTSAELAMAAVEPGRYQAEAGPVTPGTWTAWVTVGRDGLPDAVSQVRWTVAGPATGPSGLTAGTTVAALLLLGSLATVLAVAARRRKGRPRTAPPGVPDQRSDPAVRVLEHDGSRR